MKKLFYPVLMTACACFLFSGCEENNDPSAITGKLTSHSDCKIFKSPVFDQDTPDTLSCITFQYDSATNELNLTHLNAGFNCCPGELSCKVSLKNDTIFVAEYEEEQTCDCNCLFDLEIELNGVEPGEYQVTFLEPYAGDQEPLNFRLHLESETEGTCCVIRKEYPWGVTLF